MKIVVLLNKYDIKWIRRDTVYTTALFRCIVLTMDATGVFFPLLHSVYFHLCVYCVDKVCG